MYKIDDHVASMVHAVRWSSSLWSVFSFCRVGQELWVSAVDSTSLTSKKLELAEVFLTPSGNVKYHVHSHDSLTKLWPKHGVTQPAAETS
ncbi:BnaC03g42490D [Brassica napus]|uniref:BnaC03g42490D protein n=1 Tax=Brassica napus TaxID=3708 RepID=A0A078GFX2_BRANA|nr:BnaC03g42490D [Brassica napus]